MPHYFDFDGMEERLFALRHMALGSREYCRIEKVHRENDSDAWYRYLGFLKPMVSQVAIETAVKLRMIQDFVSADEQEVDLDLLDKEALNGSSIGIYTVGSSALSLRESCNKIIHATEANLSWAEFKDGTSTTEHWTGGYRLSGTKGHEPWEVQLFMNEWCSAMIRFISEIQDSVDWVRAHKYDE